LHHVFFTVNTTVLRNVVLVVLIRDVAVTRGVTVLADDLITAFNTVVVSSGSVDRAGLVSDTTVVDVLVGIVRFSSMAP
jgi:hypothetical protein